ncbi:MAG: DUF3786 domain-containing protein [Proteobacteria bacterium]|nr:DUF3786 domain-containing protein [Pseudomonadota bacterium]MBU1717118.1 DUF3786 domain-containing protein [Pseudomonadota bacterium]
MSELKNPLEVYKLLPQSNCGQCYLPTCLAFSAAVIKGDKKLADCPPLASSTTDQPAEKVLARESTDRQLAQHLASLSRDVEAIDLSVAAQRTGGYFAGGKLAVQCLGKDFWVDQAGQVSSQCHTHAGLTIPLLSYIVQSKGGDLSGNWVPFRELKNGAAMSPLFVKRCEKPLKLIADTHTDLFADLVSMFSGQRTANQFAADISLVLYPLPKLPVLICYWQPEDDLASAINIFFDATAENHLNIESIFALGTGLVMMFEKIVRQHI